MTGLHNWIRFYSEECKGAVDYRGYILPKKRLGGEDADASGQLLSLQFAWTEDGRTETKSVSSMLIGVSPEFEFALYTLCFMAGEADTSHSSPNRYTNTNPNFRRITWSLWVRTTFSSSAIQ